MDEKHTYFEEKLKQELGNFVQEPGLASFYMVQKKLEQRRKRRFLLWLFSLSGAVCLTTLTLLAPAGNGVKETHEQAVRQPQKQYDRGSATNPPAENAAIGKPSRSTRPSLKQVGIPRIPMGSKAAVAPVAGGGAGKKAPAATPVHNTPAGDLAAVDQPEDHSDEKHSVTDSLPVNVTTTLRQKTDSISTSVLSGPESQKEVGGKSARFYFGAVFTPQFGSMKLRPNPGHSLPAGTDEGFMEAYLTQRRSINGFGYDHSIGLKAGAVLKERWELNAGLAYQRISYSEEIRLPVSVKGNVRPILYYASNGSEPEPEVVHNRINYAGLSAGISRLIGDYGRRRFKAGLGVSGSCQFGSDAFTLESEQSYVISNEALNRFMLLSSIHCAWSEPLTDRFFIQFSPVFFYSFSSTFKQNYLVKQNYYSAGMELGLFFFPGKKT